MRLAFFDRYLKNRQTGVDDWPAISYFTMGAERLDYTESWPPPGATSRTFYLQGGGVLSETPPPDAAASDTYTVDFTTTTGMSNRWMTQMGNPVLNLNDRAAMDRRMLHYDTPPMTQDLQVTGTPVVTMWVDSDHTDGALLVYLEDVSEDGVSRYITEGGLRLIHRNTSVNPHFDQSAPYHSFARKDAAPLVPGEVVALTFQLWPTSVLIRRGHRLRLAIAGADADTFDRIPATGTPTIRVHRSAARLSSIDIPVVPSPRNE